MAKFIYEFEGVRGRNLKLYDTKVVVLAPVSAISATIVLSSTMPNLKNKQTAQWFSLRCYSLCKAMYRPAESVNWCQCCM